MKPEHILHALAASALAIILSALSGCMNVYTRCPGTDREIASCYQSTECMLTLSCVVAFPQVMSPGGSDEFYWENLFTIPCGLLCLCDTACEAVVDTVMLPVDYPLSRYRNGDREGDGR